MLVQQELDDIRDCIASAFVTAFPTIYSKRDVAIAYDNGVQEKIVWSVFRRKLLAHFYSYHHVGYHEGAVALLQHRRLLDDPSDSTAIASNCDFSATDGSDHSTPDSGFQEVYVARCDKEGRIESESDQAFSKRVLEFFLPVFKSLKAKTAITLQAMCNNLAAWREELRMNVNSVQDIQSRLDAVSDASDSIFIIGHDLSSYFPQTTEGRDSPGSSLGTISDQRNSSSRLQISEPFRLSERYGFQNGGSVYAINLLAIVAF